MFLEHLNRMHQNIHFTITMEMLPLSDVRKTKKPDETLGHAGYGKPTYTNLYLTTESHNCLERNQGVLKSLIIRVTEI